MLLLDSLLSCRDEQLKGGSDVPAELRLATLARLRVVVELIVEAMDGVLLIDDARLSTLAS